MVLRKRAPPHLYSLSQGNARSGPRSPTSQISPSTKSASSASPKRLTRPRRAQSSPHPRRLPSQESIYSPDLNTSPAFDLMPLEQAQKSPVRSTTTDNPNPWADELVERPGPFSAEYPAPAQSVSDHGPSHGGTTDDRGIDRVPSILVAGTQRRMAAHEGQAHPGTSDTSDWEHLDQSSSAPLQSNNPFLKPRPPQSNPWDNRDSHAQSDASSFSQDGASGRLGQDEGYIPMTARLSLFDMPESESPWTEERSSNGPPPSQQDQYVTQHASNPNATPMGQYEAVQGYPPTAPYDSVQDSHQNQAVVPPGTSDTQQDPGKLAPGHGVSTPATMSTATSGSSHVLIEFDEPSSSQLDMESASSAHDIPANEGGQSQQFSAPALPERSSVPAPSEANTQPMPNVAISEAEAERQNEQRAETYSIRKINWMNSDGVLCETPVLVQNKNGPCPLLALVNALVLRASQGSNSSVLRALQTKEQISLGLLIEALFDELISRLGPDDQFPDIEALSRFLTMLHTGMNVNPRLTLESDDAVGTFLMTSDLRFYSTFGVSLVHGWIAAPSSEEDTAMKRLAQYHEDIQLLPFRKHDLEERVVQGGLLSPEDEQAMKDIQAIEQFTAIDNATQLSPFGLNHLAEKLGAGSFSILFRNDHFSTLYKNPLTGQLFTLITDAGYSNHAEVVWESLVDVNGSQTGFFSGDFRPVGNISSEPSGPAGPRTSSQPGHVASRPNDARGSPLSVQEQADADYAYALSLQYQEEEQNNGRRESAPTQGAGVRASDPAPRFSRHSQPTGRTGPVRPVSGRPADDEEEVLPTYEQAARTPAYRTSERRTPNVPQNTSQNTPYVPSYQRTPYGRRPQGVPVVTGPSDARARRESEKCTMM